LPLDSSLKLRFNPDIVTQICRKIPYHCFGSASIAKRRICYNVTERYTRTYLDFLGGNAVPVLDAWHAKSPAKR